MSRGELGLSVPALLGTRMSQLVDGESLTSLRVSAVYHQDPDLSSVVMF